MTTLYQVSHFDQESSEDDEHDKVIGIYSTEQRAREALERLRGKPGFRDFPGWWCVGPVDLDEDGAWNDGFFTIRPGENWWEDDK